MAQKASQLPKAIFALHGKCCVRREYLVIASVDNADFQFALPKAPTLSNLVISNKRQAFAKGFATNILNPKALVFFISLMSSLVPAGMSITGKGIALVILFGLSLFWFSSLAWMLSTQRLQRKLQQAGIYIDGLCGVVFTLVGGSILYQTISTFIG